MKGGHPLKALGGRCESLAADSNDLLFQGWGPPTIAVLL